mmetsp:Transcript_120840/g.353044  ORF Transcript_120840/g.353044 Transcript_120840/m.353044 type:complete len:208 (+) Transcript_120840:1-624(+)
MRALQPGNCKKVPPFMQSVPERLEVRHRHLKAIPAEMTTVVIRNVPSSILIDELLRVWTQNIFEFNYLHLPRRLITRNAGYVFMNFSSHQAAQKFNLHWHGRFLTGWPTRKSLSITVSDIQGLRANLEAMGYWKLRRLVEKGVAPLTFIRNSAVDPTVLYVLLGLAVPAPCPEQVPLPGRLVAQGRIDTAEEVNDEQHSAGQQRISL